MNAKVVLGSIVVERSPARASKGSGVPMRSDIVPGAAFPDYELSDHTAKRRKLSELQGQPAAAGTACSTPS